MRNTAACFDIGRYNVFHIYDFKNTTARRFDASYVKKTTTACHNTLICNLHYDMSRANSSFSEAF